MDEFALEIEPSTLPRLVNRVSNVGFELGMVGMSWLAAQLGAIDQKHRAREAELADRFYSEDWVADKAKRLSRNAGMHIFAEQHIFGLQRLLVFHGEDRKRDEPVRPGESWMLERAYLGMTALTLEPDRDERDELAWLALLIRNGAYNVTEPLLEAMTRAYAIFTRVARDPDLEDHPDFVPLDDWAAQAGASLEKQFALGFATLSVGLSESTEDGRDRPYVLSHDRFADQAQRLNLGVDSALGLISGDRAWYRAQFGDAAEVRDIIWNRVPFEKRPLLRLADGSLCVVSPRALMSWLTDGFYYRALDAARAVGKRQAFTNFFGVLIENYVCDLFAQVLPGPRPTGAGVVHREQRYGGGKLTPDLAIDYGQDLVLIEIVSSRLTAATRLGLEEDRLEADLEKVLVEKIAQLSRRIDDLVAEDAALPDVVQTLVQRIWPVLVTPSGLVENELLWSFLDARTSTYLDQSKTQPLTLLDFADAERLTALIEAGHAVPDVLRAKTNGAYRRIDFRRFVNEHPSFPSSGRSAPVIANWEALTEQMTRLLGFDVDELRRLEHGKRKR